MNLSDQDIYLFREGTHARLYRTMGCQLAANGKGARFAVWAPNAKAVHVIGDWNGWKRDTDELKPRWDSSGIWEGEVAAVRRGQTYKYAITNAHGHVEERADPFAFYAEEAPATASRAWSLEYEWNDGDWMAQRKAANAPTAAQSIYEVHLGSWRREGDRMPNYRDIAQPLADYARHMGFTHVELMPITEHPFYGSWGYQTTGYFAPTSRYGTPQDFMFLVDTLHRAGVGVILDWVPSHFPDDRHALARFDGTWLYEHSDPRRGFHPEWKSNIFNYGRHEVRAFLLSSALFWLDRYHLDGIRVDAVASMLYLDYGRQPGEWIPNEYGGKEDLEAIEFLKQLNIAIGREYPDTQSIAEESTAWPSVSRPVFAGGLGFNMKWNMGWMHDTLDFVAHDPIHRRYHHNALTFSLWYAFTENFVLPLSHDEVVYGKKALISKMPGDRWQQFANLRLLLGWMWSHPGKKLLFMGSEFGQWREWNHDTALDWHLTDQADHRGLQRWVADLNAIYRREPALHQRDFSPEGFEWIDANDSDNSVLSFIRRTREGGCPSSGEGGGPSEARLPREGRGPSSELGHPPTRVRQAGPNSEIVVICNFTPVPRHGYRVGLPKAGAWREVMNSDAAIYGGSGVGNMGRVESEAVAWHGRAQSAAITLPPLGVVMFTPEVA